MRTTELMGIMPSDDGAMTPETGAGMTMGFSEQRQKPLDHRTVEEILLGLTEGKANILPIALYYLTKGFQN